MDEPIRASNTPYAIEVSANKKYFWCSCGKSDKQPFCDGSHSGTNFKPVRYESDTDKKVFFCGCKKTQGQPLCDGSHNK